MRNVLFTDVVTIYNHYTAGREDAWQRTVLRGVQYRRETTKTATADGRVAVADLTHLTIPEEVHAGGKIYFTPAEFASSELRDMAWTLNPASDMDVVVYGEVTREISAAYTLANLKRDCPDGYATIKSVKDARGRLLPIWKVVAI